MIEKRIRQVLIYGEDGCWNWEIIDVAGRDLHSDTLYPTREDAVEAVIVAQEAVIASLCGSND